MECDVHLSKDGVVVVSHDESLERMCGEQFKDKKVSDYNFNELPQFQRSIPIYSGAYQLRDQEAGRFIKLRKLFEIIPVDVFMSIEFKDNDSKEICYKVDSLIKEFNREDVTFWGSFSDKQIKLL